MRYLRSITVICQECDLPAQLGDVPVQAALEWFLDDGWVGLTPSDGSSPVSRHLTPDDLGTDARVIRSSDDLGDVPAKKVVLFCPACVADGILARFSPKLSERDRLIEAINHLESGLAALKAQVAS